MQIGIADQKDNVDIVAVEIRPTVANCVLFVDVVLCCLELRS